MMYIHEEEKAGGDMIDDALGSSWSAPIAAVSFIDEWGTAAGNSGVVLLVIAAIGIAGIFAALVFARARRSASAAQIELAQNTKLYQEILEDLLDERRGIAQPECGKIAVENSPQIADNIAEKIPAAAAGKNPPNPRKVSAKIPRKDRENAAGVPACVSTFIDQHVVRRNGAKLLPADFHAAYSMWCGEHGIEPVTLNKFGRSVTAIGFAKDSRHYLNIALKGATLTVVRA